MHIVYALSLYITVLRLEYAPNLIFDGSGCAGLIGIGVLTKEKV